MIYYSITTKSRDEKNGSNKVIDLENKYLLQ